LQRERERLRAAPLAQERMVESPLGEKLEDLLRLRETLVIR
jgi:hypothetical protein